MNISEYMATIASEVNSSAAFVYARNYDFNISGDNKVSPVILCIEPDTGFLNLSTLTGNITDGWNLFIRFIQTLPDVEIAEQAATRVRAIAEQKKWAAKFIKQLSNDDLFKDLKTPIPVISVIEAYDGNWFGVEINLSNLELYAPVGIC